MVTVKELQVPKDYSWVEAWSLTQDQRYAIQYRCRSVTAIRQGGRVVGFWVPTKTWNNIKTGK